MITRKYYLKTKSRKSIHCEIDVNKIENEKKKNSSKMKGDVA